MRIESMKRIVKAYLFSFKEVFASYPIGFIAYFLIQILNTFSQYAFLYINRWVLNDISQMINDKSLAVFRNVVLLFLISLVLSFVFVLLNYLGSLFNQKQHIRFDEYINAKMAKKSLELDISYFDNPEFYDKISRARKGKTRLSFIVYRVIFFITNIISVLVALSISISYDVKSTLLIVFFSVPMVFTQGRYIKFKYNYEKNSQREQRKISYLANVLLGKFAAKEIRFFDIDDFIVNKYKTVWNKYSTGLKRIIHSQGMADSLLASLPMVGIMVAMYFVIINIINGDGLIGDFTFYIGIYVSLSSSIYRLIEDISKVTESELSISDYRDFISLSPVINNEGTRKLEGIKDIKFEDVTFYYPNSNIPALNNVSFEIYPKKKNAIVGINGSGKTTLIKLLLRFYDTSSGKILINGVDIKEYDVDALRNCFSAVFQDYMIYSLSLRDNIAISSYSERDNDQRINNVLNMVNLADLMKEKGCSLDSLVSRDFSDDGIELSRGQKQKIAIARSIFSYADFLILDEATSSLDTESEQKLISILEEAYSEKGILYVAHRLAYMASMDNIIVLKDGQVIEQGTHNDLMNNYGEYYKLYSIQAEKYRKSQGEN